ncbi:hypothetical protein EYF80_002044 [Liparis tanakae]|uniref:Uncharacterized protein n=1 Tax=Liparis tanakae TaxID=230148 RepID=A0A4Z2JCH6_9TELE|nr:hypothetical protein EYF80_002044 [Liparis tanakae]
MEFVHLFVNLSIPTSTVHCLCAHTVLLLYVAKIILLFFFFLLLFLLLLLLLIPLSRTRVVPPPTAPSSLSIPFTPSGPPSASWRLRWPSLMGEELADSLLSGEMSLLLLLLVVWLTGDEPGAEGDFRGICHLGIVGVDGNCFLWRANKREEDQKRHRDQNVRSTNFEGASSRVRPSGRGRVRAAAWSCEDGCVVAQGNLSNAIRSTKKSQRNLIYSQMIRLLYYCLHIELLDGAQGLLQLTDCGNNKPVCSPLLPEPGFPSNSGGKQPHQCK